MNKPEISKKALKNLRSQLEHGDLQQIANKLGLSYSTIFKVFKGEIRNIKVIEQALTMVKQRNNIVKSLNNNQNN